MAETSLQIPNLNDATEKLRELEAENERLRQQVTELQADMTRLVKDRRAEDPAYQVHEFHSRMGIPICTIPAVPDAARVKLRLSLLAEEFFESLAACYPLNPSLRDAVMDEIRYCTPHVDLVELVDGWADMIYIIAGSAHEFGVRMKPIQREVHRTNMLKEPGNLRPDGKVMKPPDWRPPEVARLLRQQGWQGK